MSSTLQIPGTLEAFFFDQLEEATQESGVEVSAEVEAYLVRLLVEYARRPEVAGRRSAPFAIELLRARQLGPSALRQVGDRALFVAGVVPRSLSRSPVDSRYVRSIGMTAYREVHQRARRLSVFEELAETFEAVTRLVRRAASPVSGESESLLEVYERWRREGADDQDDDDARTLIRAGVRLDRNPGDVLQ